ncbi:MAG TPA: beta-ketoacyl synthase N-terminal-like domain-containing protein, partial [Spirochaetota bacterium]|nr:beta-ketoacyl synthase N-terminal-like domain-containing protein [Spirochaetota bacterium]
MNRRVVITGMGTINPLAHTVEETWKKLLDGESGIDTVNTFDLDGIRSTAGGIVKNLNLEKYHIDNKLANKMDAYQQLCVCAMFEAALSAKIPMRHPEEREVVFPEFEGMKPAVSDPFRLGVMLGVGVGG